MFIQLRVDSGLFLKAHLFLKLPDGSEWGTGWSHDSHVPANQHWVWPTSSANRLLSTGENVFADAEYYLHHSFFIAGILKCMLITTEQGMMLPHLSI